MHEEDLEVLITLDDPGEDTLEEDTLHRQDEITGQLRPIGKREADVIIDSDRSRLAD
jgi:hypothetical protein